MPTSTDPPTSGGRPVPARGTPPEPPTVPDDAGPLLPWLAAASAAVFLAHAWLLRAFWVDDAFITYQYARNIATGLGAVFNPGERVEGYSNPVLTFLLAGLHRLLPDPALLPAVGRGLGVACGLGAVLMLLRVPRPVPRRAIALAMVLTALCTTYALWSVGGLETLQYALLIVLGYVLTLRHRGRDADSVALGLTLGAMVLSRPEGVLPAGALYLGRLLDPASRSDRRSHLVIAGVAAPLVLAYLGWRWSYFHALIPNTYAAKRFPLGEGLRLGARYLRDFFQHDGGLALYAPAPLALVPRETRRAAGLGLLVVASAFAFALVVGGDWMDQFRFLTPVVPILFLVTALGWVTLIDALARGLAGWLEAPRRWTLRGAGVLPVLLLAIPCARETRLEMRAPAMSVIPYFTTMSRVVAATAPPEWTIATHDIGAIGWYGRTRVLDMLGLIDPRTAGRRSLAGDSAVVVRRPELVLLHYDNRVPPQGRWLPIRVPGAESLYVIPRGVEGLPRSLRVRADLREEYERRLAGLSPALRADVRALYEHLLDHHPDMYPVLVDETP